VRAGFPEPQISLLYFGLAVAAAMHFVQLWRIKTRRFVPSIRDGDNAADDDSNWDEN
jgi:hypothetical protein